MALVTALVERDPVARRRQPAAEVTCADSKGVEQAAKDNPGLAAGVNVRAGKVTNKAGLVAYRDNVEKLRNRVSGLIHEGKSQDEVGKVVMAEYGWAPGSLNMQWSVPGMMRELK